MLRDARGVFVAGCCFDELPPSVIMEAVTSARSAGAAIFFDPGPRSWTFREPQRRRALDDLLDSTDVVLMTEVPSLCSCCCSSLVKGVPVKAAYPMTWACNASGQMAPPVFLFLH